MSSSLIMPLYNEVRQIKNTISTIDLDTASDVAYAFILGLNEGDGQLLENWLQIGDNSTIFNLFILENSVELENILSLNGPMKAIANSSTAISSLLGNEEARDKILLETTALNAICSTQTSITFVINNSNVLNDFVSTQSAINSVAGNSLAMNAFSDDESAVAALNSSPLVQEATSSNERIRNWVGFDSISDSPVIVTALKWDMYSSDGSALRSVLYKGDQQEITDADTFGDLTNGPNTYQLVGYLFSGLEVRGLDDTTIDRIRHVRYISVQL